MKLPSRPMAHQHKLESALAGVRDFIRSLSVSERVAEHSDFGLSFWYEDEGTFFLTDPEAQQYRSTLEALVEAVRIGKQVSSRAVEKTFQQAILAALDLQHRRPPDPHLRLENAIDELRGFLTAPSQRFRVYRRVNGLAPDGLPSRVGNVEFVVFDDREVDRFRAAVGEHVVSEKQQELRYQLLDKLLQEEEIAGCTVGVVDVVAIEAGAAESLATWELRLTLDVINFYSDLIPYNRAHVSLPGDRDAAKAVVPQFVMEGRKKSSFSVNRFRIGRLGELSIPKLREVDSERSYGFSRVAELLAGQRNKLEEQIIASIQWAGRATAESHGDSRNEEVFLLYAIALESLILSDGNQAELTYRLRARVAHLLGDDSISRRSVFDSVKRLYDIRSKIVHTGRYQVTDADLSLIRNVTKAALIRVCTHGEFQFMTNPEHLGKWFEDRILNS